MKITFNIPGELSVDDAMTFSKRIADEYGVKILANATRSAFCEMTVYGMTAEGNDADVKSFIKRELQHVDWLRIR